MLSILGLGFLIGMQHALEADHLAAVSSLVSRETSKRRIVAHGAAWGLGHALTLALVVGLALLLGLNLDHRVAAWLEALVGITLIGLGLHLLWRLWRERVHFHAHRHGGTVHFHAHSHRGENRRTHDPARHDHRHSGRFAWHALLVGALHGMAGSAALIVLAAASLRDPWLALGYVLLFGLGSIAGMAALSLVVAVPLAFTARFMTWANRGLQGMIGTATTGFGIWLVAAQLGL